MVNFVFDDACVVKEEDVAEDVLCSLGMRKIGVTLGSLR